MVVLLNPEQVPQKLYSCMSNTRPGAYALFCAGLFLYVRCTDSPSKQPPRELVCCCKHSRTLPGMTNKKKTSHIPQPFFRNRESLPLSCCALKHFPHDGEKPVTTIRHLVCAASQRRDRLLCQCQQGWGLSCKFVNLCFCQSIPVNSQSRPN